MGMCVAGGAYLPLMCDHILMTEGSGLFLAGPALVQAAIGAKYSAEELGGAKMHSQISGTVDFREPDDQACITRIRQLVDKMGNRQLGVFDRKQTVQPRYAVDEIYGVYDSDPGRQYDMKEIIARIVDDSQFSEYKAEYGETVLCGYARIGGFAVGIVANQKTHVQQVDHAGNKRMEFGGVIYTESAEKAARFIMDCNQNLVPLIFLHDVNGFMVGRDAEWSGIIRAGAKMVNAVSNSVVPKISVIIGGSFGAGHYAMCGKAYDPRFVFRVADGEIRGDERRFGGEHAGGNQDQATGARRHQVERRRSQEAVRRSEGHVRRADGSALWCGSTVDRQDHRSGGDARDDHHGAGGGGAESRGAEVQRGSVADVGRPPFAIRSWLSACSF